MATVELKNIGKTYPNGVEAVRDFSLSIGEDEFVVLIGPSGCGKSTTLRMIAGLEDITSGDLLMDGAIVNDVEPSARNIAMVFQSYALFPHMTVFDNIALGLKLRKTPKDELLRRVSHAADILGITHLLERKPKTLSGGEKQRVAIGRAMVRQPGVFLMDEPLSNLDAKLRTQMRAEIAKLHRELQTTFIYVTHDQVEAMTLGTRLVVMDGGVIQQIGSPDELYAKPRNLFVAGFIGTPPMNLLPVEALPGTTAPEGTATIGIRPEHIRLDSEGGHAITATADYSENLGAEQLHYLKLGEQSLIVKAGSQPLQMGEAVALSLPTEGLHFFDMVGARIE